MGFEERRVENEVTTSKNDGVIFVIKRPGEDKFLIEFRTRPDSNFRGKFLFPGGAIEKEQGETEDQALLREVEEECGFVAENYSPLGDIEWDHPNDGKVRHRVFLVEYNGPIENREIHKGLHLEVNLRNATILCDTKSGVEVIRLLKAQFG